MVPVKIDLLGCLGSVSLAQACFRKGPSPVDAGWDRGIARDAAGQPAAP